MSTSSADNSFASGSREQLLRNYLQVFVPAHEESGRLDRHTLTGPAPLSYAQQQLWFHSRVAAGKPIYNEQVTLHREGQLNLSFLRRALNEIVHRHEAWRTVFKVQDGQVYQYVEPSFEVPVRFLDLRSFSATDRDAQDWSMAHREVTTTFDLAAAPPIRALLVQLNDRKYRLHLTLHQIIFDGVSIFNIFLPELTALYNAFTSGAPPYFSELPIQYTDYALWEREQAERTALSAQLEYWQRQLAGAPTILDLPRDYAAPTKQTFRGAQINFSVPGQITEKLKELSRQQRVTLFMTLLACYAVVLSRHANQKDLLIGTVTSTRKRAELELLLGLFLNTVVLRIQLNDDMRFTDLLSYVREITLGALCNNDVPTQKLVEMVQPARDPGRNPLFQAMFVLEPPASLSPPGWSVTEMDVATGTSRVDLHLQMDDRPEGLVARLIYNVDLFEQETAVRLQQHFVSVLQNIVDQPDTYIRNIKLHVPPGRNSSQVSSNQVFPSNRFTSFSQEDSQRSICDRFEQQTLSHPDRIAIKTKSCSWTYDTLNRTANRIAHTLIDAHGGKNERVALIFQHDGMMIAALIAVLKSGKTYVALDPLHPSERTKYILDDSDASVLLTDNDSWTTAQRFAGTLPIISVDRIRANVPVSNLQLSISPTTTAYILYTSGSTGEPKGVVQSHQNVLFFIRAYTNALHIHADDRLTLISSFCFDAAVMDIFAALLNGAALHPIDVRQEGVTGLADCIDREHITIYHSTPTVFRYLLRNLAPTTRFTYPRLVVLGGEAVEQPDFELFKSHFSPDSIFVNGLGPTESTLALQYFLGQRSEIQRASIPAGYPVEGTDIVLLDDAGNVVDLRGEIGIQSAHVALGYWQRPELTAKAFLPDPAGGDRRIYRTGDIGYVLPEGSIAFLGRKDGQVKIRGFRIELGELEAVITRHPAVRSAAVTCEKHAGESRLCAYVVRETDESLGDRQLRRFLQTCIPDYMMPSRITFVPELPLTPSGKIDRLALVSLPQAQPTPDAAFVPPRDQIQVELVGIWEAILNTKPIGIQDNFFDLGGHSLLVAKLLASIERKFSRQLGMAAIFEAPTIEQLSQLLSCRAQSPPSRGVVPIQSSGSRPPFFCIRGGPLFRGLASELGSDQPFLGIHLQASDLERLRVPYDLRDVAAIFVERIQELQPVGPYYVGGLCVNGIVAYEVAQQLFAKGQTVGLVVLFDAQSPTFHAEFLRQYGSLKLMAARVQYHVSNLLKYRNFVEFSRDRLSGLRRRARRLLWDGAYALQFRVREMWVGDFDPVIHPAATRYYPLPFAGPALLFQSTEHPQGAYWDLQAHWKNLITDLKVYKIAGDHDSIFRGASVRVLAEKMASSLYQETLDTAVSF